jgi:hypothetical protein
MYLAEGYTTKAAHSHVNAFQVNKNFEIEFTIKETTSEA